MAKSGLILSGVDNDNCTRLNSGSSMQDGVVTISKFLYFRVPNGENPRQYNDLDVYSHPNFPKKYSALSQDPRYKFYGNASVRHDLDDGKYFTAELEYSTQSPNETDEDGKEVNSDTKPWKLKPDNISFSYPEDKEPFEASYTKSGVLYDQSGNILRPVQNSAGDPFIAERTVRNMEMSFTFSAKTWNPNNALDYGGTINSETMNVCGMTIPAGRGLLYPPECEYITTYEDDSDKIKWQYWSVRITIFIAYQKDALVRKVLDIGDRALFDDKLYSDDLIKNSFTLAATNTKAGQICRFRKYVEMPQANNKYSYVQMGDNVFCSWEQFIAFRQAALNEATVEAQSNSNFVNNIDPQCEQLSQIPLTPLGKVDEQAIIDKKYRSLTFREYPTKSWAALNLPKKGIKW